MFGGQTQRQQQQNPGNNSHRSSIESALSNISGIMNVYNQHGSAQVPRRSKNRQRRSVPYTQVRPLKRKVVQLITQTKFSSSSSLQQPWSYKDFNEIWEGNVEYTDETSEEEVLKYICNAFNSTKPPEYAATGDDIDPSRLLFVHRKNGKLTTRPSATYDGAGIQCNYRQSVVYLILLLNEDQPLATVQTNMDSFLCTSEIQEMQNATACSSSSNVAPSTNVLMNAHQKSTSSIPTSTWTSSSNASCWKEATASGSSLRAPLVNTSGDVKKLVMEAGFTEQDVEKGLLACGSLADASDIIEWICDSQETSCIAEDISDIEQTPEERLIEEMSKLVNEDDDHFLYVNRNEIWKSALTFYKQCMGNASKLHRNLVISFEGEEGVDAGAVKIEFFSSLIEEIDKRLFEGRPHSRVPKKSWGTNHHMIAGMIIGHSLLQSGPAYSVLAPSVYNYLCSASEDAVMQSTDMLPCIDDIPRDASTITIHDVIHKMDEASTQEDIDAILDVPEYLEVINGSGWPCTQTVAISNKNEIVQGLIAEEVIRKRMKSMDDLRKGLNVTGILALMGSYPAQLKKFFVDGDNTITAEEFKRQFSKECVMPIEYPACQVYKWYMEYIAEGEKTSEEFPHGRLIPLLQFTTSYKRIPPLGLRHKLSIQYLADDEKNELPVAHACFGIIKLPVIHTSKAVFFKKIDTALIFGSQGFGMM